VYRGARDAPASVQWPLRCDRCNCYITVIFLFSLGPLALAHSVLDSVSIVDITSSFDHIATTTEAACLLQQPGSLCKRRELLQISVRILGPACSSWISARHALAMYIDPSLQSSQQPCSCSQRSTPYTADGRHGLSHAPVSLEISATRYPKLSIHSLHLN
jgi:hypothetical protein